MRSVKLAGSALTILLGIQALALPALAALSSPDIIAAINKRQFLPPGTALNVKIDKDQVYVSTFRHAKAEDKDCKIDAVLITRAIMETAPDEVARVTSYFYGKDMSSYQEVSVSAGDIKAFASGSMSQDQLLASLAVKIVNNREGDTTEDKVSRQLQSNIITRPSDYKIVQDKPNSLTVTTNLDPWVSDDEARLEGLRIATNTFVAQPDAEMVKVVFTDPAVQAETRQFDFITNRLDPIWKAVQNAVGSVLVQKKPAAVDLQVLRTVKGTQQEARDAILAQLRDMDKKGIGVAAFVKAFLSIEQSVKREVDPKYITEMVTRLKASLDDQMKAYSNAKEKKVVTKPAEVKAAAPIAPPTGKTHSRWVTGESPIIPGEVLANPDALVGTYESRLSTGYKRVEDNPAFVLVLDRVSEILTQNNRASDAAKFQQRAAQIRAAHPKF